MPDSEGQTPRRKLAALLAAVDEKSGTGVLDVFGPEGLVQVHFKGGRVVRVLPAAGSEWLLLPLLVESGAIPPKKVPKILKRQRKTGHSAELAVIEQGLLSRDVLSKYLELQVREVIIPLLLLDEVDGVFREEMPQANDFVRPVPVPFLLREWERREKEWPILRRSSFSLDAVYDKTDDSIDILFGEEEEDEPPTELSAGERVIYYYLNGKKTVRQLSFVSCLGEFETIRALHLLQRRGFLNLVTREGRGERRREWVFLRAAVTFLFSLLLLALIGGIAVIGPLEKDDPKAFLVDAVQEEGAAMTAARGAHLRAAIELFYAWQGRYPETLDILVERGLITEPRLAADAAKATYRPLPTGYEFALPPRAERP